MAQHKISIKQKLINLGHFIKNVPAIARVVGFFKDESMSFYLITGTIFIIWITFLDGNNLISQYQMTQKLQEVHQQEMFYREEIKKLEQEIAELTGNSEKMEKFAREKYFFKRKGEDIYYVKEIDE